MSNEATATKKIKFNEASAGTKPTLVCTGYVSQVEDTAISKKSGNYNVTPISINGIGASQNTKIWLCTRPEWFEVDGDGNPSFRPDDLKKVEGGKSMHFVYSVNISGKEGISNLLGLSGNEDRFGDLSTLLFTTPGVTEEDGVELTKVLRNFLVAKEGKEPFTIGYILKQQRTKTDAVDENGKAVYVLEKNYELDDYFEVTPEALKKYRRAAEKSARKAEENGTAVTFKIAYDEATPF